MQRTDRFVILLILLAFVFSCTPQKKLVYLRNAKTGTHETGRQFVYTLNRGDILSITIYSVNEKAVELFSPNRGHATNISSEIGAFLHGFLISDSGDINLPLAGKIRIEGLPLQQASEVIQAKIREYFLDAIVDVKLINFNVTILGEVNRPGRYRVYEPSLNILEAISLAGDLSVYGKRDIKLIRATENGYEIFEIDLKDRNLLTNKHFYLLPNDIIYVEPHKAKTFGFGTVPISLLLSTITTFILLLNFVLKV